MIFIESTAVFSNVDFMKTALFILLILLNLSPACAEEKKIALVFNGGGFKTAMFLGMLKGVKEAGLKPDIIIGTCGGSIPAAIAHSIADSEGQQTFVESEEFYEMLKSIDFTEYASVRKTLFLAEDFYIKFKLNKIIPDIFSDYLMNVPKEIDLSELSLGFEPKSHRTVIIAAKVLFTEKETGKFRKKGKKLFKQSIFTDSKTADELKGFIAPNSGFKNSAITPEVDFITDAKLAEASRASISDPFYMEPAHYNGDRFVTGAVDLYPMELARRLADKVIFALPTKFDIVEQGAIFATFNFSHNKRHAQVFDDSKNYLIDSTDFPSKLDFTPAPNFLTWKMKTKVPKTYEEYRQLVRSQFEYGYKQALKAAKGWSKAPSSL